MKEWFSSLGGLQKPIFNKKPVSELSRSWRRRQLLYCESQLRDNLRTKFAYVLSFRLPSGSCEYLRGNLYLTILYQMYRSQHQQHPYRCIAVVCCYSSARSYVELYGRDKFSVLICQFDFLFPYLTPATDKSHVFATRYNVAGKIKWNTLYEMS